MDDERIEIEDPIKVAAECSRQLLANDFTNLIHAIELTVLDGPKRAMAVRKIQSAQSACLE